MRANSLLAAVSGLVLAGCATAPKVVYVDLARVRAHPDAPIESDRPPSPGLGQPAVTISALGRPAREIHDDAGARMAAARREIRADEEQTRRDLARGLTSAYMDQVKAAGLLRLRALDPEREAARAAADAELMARFVQYAEAREPLIGKYKVISTPGNTFAFKSRTDKPNPYEVKRQAEIGRLERAIHDLDVAYDADAQAIETHAGATIEEKALKLRREVEAAQLAVPARAEAEAARQVRQSLLALALQPTGVSRRLPALPALSKTVAASPRPTPAPLVGIAPERAATRRKGLDAELKIWSRTRGYDVVSRQQGANDATEEFIKWRTQAPPGH